MLGASKRLETKSAAVALKGRAAKLMEKMCSRNKRRYTAGDKIRIVVEVLQDC